MKHSARLVAPTLAAAIVLVLAVFTAASAVALRAAGDKDVTCTRSAAERT